MRRLSRLLRVAPLLLALGVGTACGRSEVYGSGSANPDPFGPGGGNPAPDDGGLDDAGARDAGSPDAGRDAGTPDAGAPDAGRADAGPDAGSPSACASPRFETVGPLAVARDQLTATALPDGTVLVLGGHAADGTSSRVDRYSPSTRTFQSIDSPGPRELHTATPLPGGQVLFVGGQAVDAQYTNQAPPLDLTLYSTATGRWSSAGQLATRRIQHSATALPDGCVLIVGGKLGNTLQITAESLRWCPTPTPGVRPEDPLPSTLYAHTATALEDGSVLVVGGYREDYVAESRVWRFDGSAPSGQRWKATGRLADVRGAHTATRLADGRVLVVGGLHHFGPPRSDVEFYDPRTERWTSARRLTYGRWAHTATLLKDGRVLVVGGLSPEAPEGSHPPPELYLPERDTWLVLEAPELLRAFHAAALLTDGTVLLTGGHLNEAGYVERRFDSSVLFRPCP